MIKKGVTESKAKAEAAAKRKIAKEMKEAAAKEEAEAAAKRKIAKERKEAEAQIAEEEAEKILKWKAGYRKYKVIHKNLRRMFHPSQAIYITTEPTEVKLDSWVESQLNAKLIAEVEK